MAILGCFTEVLIVSVVLVEFSHLSSFLFVFISFHAVSVGFNLLQIYQNSVVGRIYFFLLKLSIINSVVVVCASSGRISLVLIIIFILVMNLRDKKLFQATSLDAKREPTCYSARKWSKSGPDLGGFHRF